jgi:hypothetical protein
MPDEGGLSPEEGPARSLPLALLRSAAGKLAVAPHPLAQVSPQVLPALVAARGAVRPQLARALGLVFLWVHRADPAWSLPSPENARFW